MAKYHAHKMKILDAPSNSNWLTAIIDGLYCQAKIFTEPSTFGINDGHVSKLSVCSGQSWDHTKVIINYDRGWDVGENRPELDSIVGQLEAYAQNELRDLLL